MFLHSIFKVQVLAKMMGSVIWNYKSDKHDEPVISPLIVSTHNFRLQ